MSDLIDPIIRVEMVVWCGDAPRYRVPVDRALLILQKALEDSGGDHARAADALRRAFDSLKQMV